MSKKGDKSRTNEEVIERKLFENDVVAELGMDFQSIEKIMTFSKVSCIAVIRPHEIDQLRSLHSTIYDCPESDITVHSTYKRYATITARNTLIGSHKSRSRSSSIVIAKTNFEMFGHSDSQELRQERPVRIKYFAMHSIF